MTVPLRRSAVGVLVVCAMALFASPLSAQVSAKYLYNLSSYLGPLHYDGIRINVDRARDETYFVYQGVVRIFNASGMEVFSFGDDLDVGQVVDASADRNGDILVLSFKNAQSVVTRCNYRGVPIGTLAISNLPEGTTIRASRMVVRDGVVYLADLGSSRIYVVDPDGRCRQVVDLAQLIGRAVVDKAGGEIFGFTVDDDGSIYCTMATLFKVYKVLPDGTLKFFGRPGSAAGRFGIISGIAIDGRGDILVTDKLRSVVMVFNKDFGFVSEFGRRGLRPEDFIVPDDIAVDRQGRVYIAQGRRRGVSVFALAGQ